MSTEAAVAELQRVIDVHDRCFECCGRGWVMRGWQGAFWNVFCPRCHGSGKERAA